MEGFQNPLRERSMHLVGIGQYKYEIHILALAFVHRNKKYHFNLYTIEIVGNIFLKFSCTNEKFNFKYKYLYRYNSHLPNNNCLY